MMLYNTIVNPLKLLSVNWQLAVVHTGRILPLAKAPPEAGPKARVKVLLKEDADLESKDAFN